MLIAYLPRGSSNDPTDSRDSYENCARRDGSSRLSRVRVQLEAVEGDEKQAGDAHHPIDDILHNKNRIVQMAGRSVKVLHLLMGHSILQGAGLRPS